MSGETQNGKMSEEELASLRRFADRPGLLLKTASGLDGAVGDRTTVHRLLDHIAAIQREAEAERARGDAMREALEGLVAAVVKDSNEHGISGYTGARLSDASAALSQARGEPSLSSANPE